MARSLEQQFNKEARAYVEKQLPRLLVAKTLRRGGNKRLLNRLMKSMLECHPEWWAEFDADQKEHWPPTFILRRLAEPYMEGSAIYRDGMQLRVDEAAGAFMLWLNGQASELHKLDDEWADALEAKYRQLAVYIEQQQTGAAL